MQNFILRVAAAAASLVVLGACGSDSTSPSGAAPTVASVAPATGTVGTELTITGTDFRDGASVLVGSTAATAVEVANPTTIYASVPAGVVAGQSYEVTVQNNDGTSAKKAAAFEVVTPTLLYVNGATKPSGNAGSTVILEGAAFGDAQGTGQVLFSDGASGTVAATITNADDWTDGFIVTTVPAGAATGPVVVQTATGTSAALTFTVASNAQFSPSTISWSSTTPLPVGLSGHAAAFATVEGASAPTNFVYVTGGADSSYTPGASVYFAQIADNGQLGAWTSTAPLPAAVAFHASVAATPFNSRVKGPGYIYVFGGAVDASGTPTNAVYRGTLGTDGAVSAWSAAGQLPAAVHSLGAVLFRGDIYLVGGSGADNTPVAEVYRARLDSLGTIGEWVPQPALPLARSYARVAQFGGYLYAFGGDTGAVTPNDSNYTSNATKLNEVVYARINLRTGDLADPTWTPNNSGMTKAASKHTVVVAGGNVLVTGGLYNGAATGSSEESYAQFNSDGTVSSFAGATGAHTIASAGGKNLFNHAALGYVDANGVAHVLVIGGDDVNAPGKKRAEVWFY